MPLTDVDTKDTGKFSIDDIFNSLGDDSKDDKNIDLLSDDKSKSKDDDKTEEKIDTKDDVDSAEEDDEIKELDEEEEDEEVVEDKLELITPVGKKQILAKYPTLFKDFPYLEKAYYKEQQYTELFPTVEDAREASDKIESFSRFESDLMSGNPTSVLASVKESDPDAFGRMVDNYLPSLQKVDKEAYFHIVGNIIKGTISSMVREADDTKSEDLKTAAVILHQFIHGNSRFEPPKPFGKPAPDNKDDELNIERARFIQDRIETAQDELDTKTSNAIKSTIANNIDPRGVMSDYVKRNAIKDAMEQVEEMIGNDKRFRAGVLDKLWLKARSANFSRNSLEDIKKAYLSKAKTLLRPVIEKARNEALKGSRRSSSDTDDEPKKRGLITGDKRVSSGSSKSKNDPSKIDRSVKSIDYLMED